MINVLQEKIRLRNGLETPALLFGTYKKIDQQSMSLALEHGFRAFDMATVYQTDDLVLNGIKDHILKHKLVNSRSKFYFCYKLEALRLSPGQVKEQVQSLLAKISEVFPEVPAYIDMLAIHAPNHQIPIEQTWSCMTEMVLDAKVLAIGVSNFTIHHLQCMQTMQLAMPAINQVETNPFFAQPELTEYCAAHKIIISSYRSANNKATAGDLTLVARLAAELNMTPMQVINSWKFTKGLQIVAISKDPLHLEELKLVKILDSVYMQYLDSLDKGEAGRTCIGDWSHFDFNGHVWKIENNYEVLK